MGKTLLVYGPPVLAWILALARRPGRDRGRRAVRGVFLGLAVSQSALTPAGSSLIKLAGGPDVSRLIGHAGMVFAVWAGLQALTHVNGLHPRWPTWWVAGTFAAMCVLFSATPDLLPQSPWVMEYVLAYVAAQVPVLVLVIRLCLRYARAVADRALRAGLWLMAAGVAGAICYYLFGKAAPAMAPRFGFDFPFGRTFFMAKVLPPLAHVLVLAGAALPAVSGRLSRRRLDVRLRPLWTDLCRANPAIALDPPSRRPFGNPRMRLYRRVIEIRDGLLALRPYRDAEVARSARETAEQAGLTGRPLEAAVEAAVVTAALRSLPGGEVAPTEAPIPGGDDLAADAAFLAEVADAYGKAPRISTPSRRR